MTRLRNEIVTSGTYRAAMHADRASSRARTLHVSDIYFPRVNGVSTSIQTFRRELARLGHETTLVAPAYPAPHEDDARTVRVASRSVPLDPEDRAMRWHRLGRVDRQLAGARFDLV